MSNESKQTLWVFGDSHTLGYGCLPGFEYYEKYYKDGDKIWPDIIGQYLNVNLINRGRSGSSNDMIMDNIIDSFNNIKNGDIIIIGKTYTNRFDVPNIQKNELIPIFWNWDIHESKETIEQFNQEQKETIINFQYNFMSSPLFNIRWDKRYRWIRSILEDMGCKIVVWDVTTELKKIETIGQVTNREINDGHMSFQGHFDFATYMWNKWFKEKTII